MPLYQRRCPTTVTGLVVLGSVNSIERHLWRTFAHVREKMRKLIPTFADLHASCAVHGIFLVARIVASSQHATPAYPSRRHRHSVPCNRRQLALAAEASARGRMTFEQAISSWRSKLSAVAPANPFDVLAWLCGSLDNQEPAKSLSGKIVGFHSHTIATTAG